MKSLEPQKFNSFREFWPFYLREHSVARNRQIHFIGTAGSLIFLFVALGTRNAWWLCGMPLCGYSFAWFGHFIIEKNRPATFRHPWWSLMGDYRMFFLMLRGKL